MDILILSHFLQGEVDFVQGVKQEDPDATTIRMLRALVEIPYLRISKSSEKYFEKALKGLIQKLRDNIPITQTAVVQFEKLARNSRFGMGGNRFYQSHENIDKLASELAGILYGDARKPLIPEFLFS